MGIYSSSQFLGIFVGGVAGGIILQHFSLWGIFIFSTLLLILWQAIAIFMKEPPYLSTITYPINPNITIDSIYKHLKLPGICEAFYMEKEQLLYLKIDKKIITKDELHKYIEESNLIVADSPS